MAAPDRRIETSETNRTLIIVVAVIAAIVIAGLFYGLMRLGGGGGGPTGLQGAIREGSPQFAENKQNIVLDDPEATEAKRALGDITMTLSTTVRNLTGKTLSGLEIRGAVVDYEGKPVKQRAVVVIPGKQPELLPNKTLQVNIALDGMSDTDARANIKMEVTGFKFKE
ncbi:MAG TPA: hypothetical protein VFS90_07145 [Pyrinomonadaceae bacterium]|nr:hypothetical protein [Pyrinomonadaceae bacterium]